MNRFQAVGVLLIALGLIYALIYVGWLRRERRRPTPAVANEPTPAWPSALIFAYVEGTYISTTMATHRLERVAAAGLGDRAKATMVVDHAEARWECEGAGEVRVAGARLRRVSLERGMAAMFVGRARIVLVSWEDDNGDRCATGFRPRRRADSPDLAEAVQRLIHAQKIPDGTP